MDGQLENMSQNEWDNDTLHDIKITTEDQCTNILLYS